jgi:holin-like protein
MRSRPEDAVMARSFLGLLVCQGLGELIQRVTGLPLSGPVIGMVILLAAMMVRAGPSTELRTAATSLLGYLSLLFVPSAVGVMAYLPVLQRQWLPVAVALIASTILGMVSAGLVMQTVNRRYRSRVTQLPIAGQLGEVGEDE